MSAKLAVSGNLFFPETLWGICAIGNIIIIQIETNRYKGNCSIRFLRTKNRSALPDLYINFRKEDPRLMEKIIIDIGPIIVVPKPIPFPRPIPTGLIAY